MNERTTKALKEFRDFMAFYVISFGVTWIGIDISSSHSFGFSGWYNVAAILISTGALWYVYLRALVRKPSKQAAAMATSFILAFGMLLTAGQALVLLLDAAIAADEGTRSWHQYVSIAALLGATAGMCYMIRKIMRPYANQEDERPYAHSQH